MIPARTLDQSGAEQELEALHGDSAATEEAILEGLQAVNRVVRAHRIASQDPYDHEIGRLTPLAVRVGFGTGTELADGKWTEAFEAASPERRRRRADALRPQERLAELLAGRESIDVCETLLLRARADLDQGRPREAALQLRPGLDALLAEVPDRAGPGQDEDLARLQDRRDPSAGSPTPRSAASRRPSRRTSWRRRCAPASAFCAGARPSGSSHQPSSAARTACRSSATSPSSRTAASES